jgi:DNA-binding transcriptional LysR family regulator
MTLSRSDVSLLPLLQVLLTEASVGKAAERLGLTQSAVSQALSRARAIWQDELLIRHGQRMFRTPQAVELLGHLDSWLIDTQRLFVPAGTEPAQTEVELTIISNDYSEVSLLPPIVASLSTLAPRMTILLRSIEAQPMTSAAFMDGQIHFALAGINPPSGPFETAPLFDERFVVIMRHGHPCASKPLTINQYAGLQHALVSPQGQGLTGPIDLSLAKLGRSRHIALSLTRFTSLASLLQSTDLIATVPFRFALSPEVKERCCVVALPFPSPSFTMSLIWHKRYRFDPVHQWVRELIVKTLHQPN